MKLLLPALALAPWLMFGWLGPRQADRWVLLVAGDADGYLSPCGCVKPMSGGMRRLATATDALGRPGRTVFVHNGALVSGLDRQSEIKAETWAEALGAMKVAALNLAPADAKLGPGAVASMDRLSRQALVSGSIRASASWPGRAWVRKGPFLIGGASAQPDALSGPLMESPVPLDAAVTALIAAAEAEESTPVLLLQGDLAIARKTARDHPGLALIVYRSSAAPPKEPDREGETWLVTPGDRAKFVVRVEWNGGWRAYGVADLGPQYADDPAAERLYRAYQGRVRAEKLLEAMPREAGEAFAGSAACADCHTKAHASWSDSQHAVALRSLEDDGADRDPDCTGCHVVGLGSMQGFRSRKETPDLADVGCESCHGPGRQHVDAPREAKMPKVGEASCLGCHNPDHSPKFDFGTYWPQIEHGKDD